MSELVPDELTDEDAAKYWWRKCGQLEGDLAAKDRQIAEQEKMIKAVRMEISELLMTPKDRPPMLATLFGIPMDQYQAFLNGIQTNAPEGYVEVFRQLTESKSLLAGALKLIGEQGKRVKELEAMTQGRTVSCVCGGADAKRAEQAEARVKEYHDKWVEQLEAKAKYAEALFQSQEREARLRRLAGCLMDTHLGSLEFAAKYGDMMDPATLLSDCITEWAALSSAPEEKR